MPYPEGHATPFVRERDVETKHNLAHVGANSNPPVNLHFSVKFGNRPFIRDPAHFDKRNNLPVIPLKPFFYPGDITKGMPLRYKAQFRGVVDRRPVTETIPRVGPHAVKPAQRGSHVIRGAVTNNLFSVRNMTVPGRGFRCPEIKGNYALTECFGRAKGKIFTQLSFQQRPGIGAVEPSPVPCDSDALVTPFCGILEEISVVIFKVGLESVGLNMFESATIFIDGLVAVEGTQSNSRYA